MKVIYKYEIPFDNIGRIEMPRGAKPLAVSSMNDAMHIHALVETEAPIEARYFRIFGTGGVPEGVGLMVHIGSLTMPRDRLMFHVFEDVGQ